MIALRYHEVDLSSRAATPMETAWEAAARERSAQLLTSRTLAVELLESLDEELRILAVQSFYFRWPIDDRIFQRVRSIACSDPVLEIRVIGITLLSGMNRRCHRSDREAVRQAIAEAARWPGQNEEIAEYAEVHYRATEEPSADIARSPELHSAEMELTPTNPLP